MSTTEGPDLASSFDRVAAEYDAARPSYPDALFDAVEELSGIALAGAEVLDVGAGTGISSRALAARGASVTAVEPTPGMADRLHAVSPEIRLVRGDGNALPFRDSCADLVSYAQSFHWTDHARSVPEAIRVLRPGGALALWWNVKDREVRWVAEQSARLRAACPAYHGYRPFDESPRELSRYGVRVATATLRWERRTPVETALLDQTSRSYVAVLDSADRERLLAAEREALLAEFPDGVTVEPYVLELTVALPEARP
ncbi:class I SAM-dependent methyltransferase [Streptacidiphilus griseoplanus]|uniref:class I SAM-dependent methyltransferase n=1 Tax=Peterkaempfera griseoplana TaxID=66896 RepID=UPI0006E2636C|nr:class I SAM-dependent methyltransferase [Peterkaempfera griseoplana]